MSGIAPVPPAGMGAAPMPSPAPSPVSSAEVSSAAGSPAASAMGIDAGGFAQAPHLVDLISAFVLALLLGKNSENDKPSTAELLLGLAALALLASPQSSGVLNAQAPFDAACAQTAYAAPTAGASFNATA